MNSPEDLKIRTKRFAEDIVRLAEALPATRTGEILSRQIIRSATSVGANYRAACRARSRADFVSKLCIALEEADETGYWLEVMGDLNLVPAGKHRSYLAEASGLTAIFTSSIKTAKANKESGGFGSILRSQSSIYILQSSIPRPYRLEA